MTSPKEIKSVKETSGGRRAPLFMAAFVLALCSATGLLTGVITREVASAASVAPATILAQATSTPTLAPTPTLTSSPTSAPAASNQFVVSVAVAGQPHPGQNVQVSASTVTADSGAPVVGANCALGPVAGGETLLQVWPDPATTDTMGKCGWAITIPQQTAPGAYRVRVDGYTTQYHAWAVTTIHVS